MEALLANYYVEFKPRVNTDWIILCILHELRIVSFKQIYELINLTFPTELISKDELKSEYRACKCLNLDLNTINKYFSSKQKVLEQII